jgi:SPP1 gp7 family putative phage head morphogenesis protein
MIMQVVGMENIAGLDTAPTANAQQPQPSFESHPERLKRFRAWLREQMGSTLAGDAVLEEYIRQSYTKGQQRGHQDAVKGRKASTADVISQIQGKGSSAKAAREEFIRQQFSKRPTLEKVKLLAARTFTDLEGINGRMATRMQRILVEAMVQGKTPMQAAREMAREVDIELPRALAITRTELVRAHAEGQLDALESLGVEEVAALVEWRTTGDSRVCEKCKPLDGKRLTLKEARGKLPVHPQCRCAWSPVKGQPATAPRPARKPRTRPAGPLAFTPPPLAVQSVPAPAMMPLEEMPVLRPEPLYQPPQRGI